MEKKCKTCDKLKDTELFYKTSNGKGIGGVGCICKECSKEITKPYREINKEKILKKQRDKYNDPETGELVRKYNRNYYNENKDVILPIILERQKQKTYRNKRNLNYRLKYNTDETFKLKNNLKRAIQKSLKNGGFIKKNKTTIILGRSISEFKIYLESKFEPWMNWGNYGKYKKGEINYGWDIDHVIPISSAITEEELIKLNHYTNLQPLCSYINRYVKKDNYEQKFISTI